MLLGDATLRREDGMLDVEHILLGVALACGVVVVACLSGLPSTTCAALAETYAQAAMEFGAVAVISLSSILLIVALEYSKWVMAPLSILLFLAVCTCHTNNLRISVIHCYTGKDAEIAAKLHEGVELLSITRPDRWFKLWQRWP